MSFARSFSTSSSSSDSGSSSLPDRHSTEVVGYQLGEEIGAGTSGRVVLGRRISNPRDVIAVKIISKAHVGHFGNVEREVGVHLRLRHSNIIRLHNAIEGQHFAYVLLEYAASGDLFSVIRTYPSLPYPYPSPYPDASCTSHPSFSLSIACYLLLLLLPAMTSPQCRG